MQHLSPILAVTMLTLAGCTPNTSHDIVIEHEVLDAACGQCLFDLPGSGCDLAVRIDGKAYFVDGTGIDDHGDAHAHDGLCNAIRQARASGAIVDGRFESESFELVPVTD